MKKIAVLFSTALLMTFTLTVQAAPAYRPHFLPNALFFYEDFVYTNGPLVGQGGWAAHSGAGNKAIQVSSETITLNQGSGSGEDVNLTFPATTASDTTYYGLDLTLPSGQTTNPANGLYFIHFNSVNNHRARVFVVAPTGGGDFGLAISADSSTPSATWASDLDFDTTYRIVASYNAATGESKLWVDPVNEASLHVSHTGTAGTTFDSLSLRQSTEYTGNQILDNIKVGTTFDDVPTKVGLQSVQTENASTAVPFIPTFILSMLTAFVLIKRPLAPRRKTL
ncbi:MAG: hypothetical protein KDE51_12070 [Anaerolineales bacterium]|nr:hypothetical protein [Anaerolineales bacterium]